MIGAALLKKTHSKLWCAQILGLVCLQSLFAAPGSVLEPELGIAPLWVVGGYGLYWGVSLSGGATIGKLHRVSAHVDLAPVGGLGITDVATEGREQHWGGTLGYQLQLEMGNGLLRVAPGATAGLSSIPYVFGTFPGPGADTAPRGKHPKRETIWGAGPELSVSVGSRRVRFFVDGRMLFATGSNWALLTNAGVSFGM